MANVIFVVLTIFFIQVQCRPSDPLDDITKHTEKIMNTLTTEIERITEEHKNSIKNLKTTFQTSMDGFADKLSTVVEDFQKAYSVRTGEVDDVLKTVMNTINETTKKVQNAEILELEQIKEYQMNLAGYYDKITGQLKSTAESIATDTQGMKEEVVRNARSMLMELNKNVGTIGQQIKTLVNGFTTD